ncbi:hypothetical protein [Synechococcus phage DSL-LC07]|nr:hypothetical protein [Synechococcus phage DSL-LC07]
MKLNIQRLLETCIDEGIEDSLGSLNLSEMSPDQLRDRISEYIWLQLDYYFDFEDN